MRYILICLAAFMLFASAAFANTVSVKVVVPAYSKFVITDKLEGFTFQGLDCGLQTATDNLLIDDLCSNQGWHVDGSFGGFSGTGGPEAGLKLFWDTATDVEMTATPVSTITGGAGCYDYANANQKSMDFYVTRVFTVAPDTYTGTLTLTLVTP
jgi:hypothetical protein